MKVSFIVPAFNCAEFLHHAVDSCLKQTHKDIEVVIIDDGSTDSTADYLKWLNAQGDKRVVSVSTGKNIGRSEARKLGNDMATGDILAVLDADDLSTPRRAELTVAKFAAGAQFVHGAAHRMDAVGRDLGLMPTDVFNKEKAIETLTNGIVHSTVAYSKEFAKLYPYQGGDVAKLGLDDWACFLAAAIDGVKFEYIPVPLCAYREGVGISAIRDEDEVKRFKKAYLEGFRLVKV